jgi:ribulose-5-phosphate 4-epimerase/fuculose-1-phosphate aldolase
MLFSEITASSLVHVDLKGNVVGESEYPVNRAGLAIHGAIQEARPDVNCVFHTHTPNVTAVASLECGLLPMSQAALQFYGQLAYHDYGRAASDPTERSRLQEDMADRWYMLMRNHGALTLGKTVGQAFMAAYYMEKACEFQVLAQSTGQTIIMTPEYTREKSDPSMRGEERAWPGLMRMLDREDPSYRD